MADQTLAEAAEEGRLPGLTALRDRLARQIDSTESGRDVAALSQRLMDVLEQIDRLSAGTKSKGTALDELAARRQAAKRPSARPSRAKVQS